MSPKVHTIMAACSLLLLWSFTSTLCAQPVPYNKAAASLPTPETVIPAEVSAENFHAPEGQGRCTVVESEKGPVLRIEIDRKMTNIWDAGLKWPTAAAIEEKDLLLLVFELRSLDPQNAAEVRAVFRRSEKPYNHALSETCKAAEPWKEFALAFPAKDKLGPEDGLLIFNLGTQAQTLEMRRVRLLNFSRKINLHSLLGVLKRSAPRSPRSAVGQHLQPELLWEMNAFSEFADIGKPFNPNDKWRHTYAIWTCHGYMHRANKNLGLLTIQRQRAPRAGMIDLSAERLLINDTGEVHKTEVTARCRSDVLTTPVSWRLQHTVIPPDDTAPEARLTLKEDGSLADGKVSLAVDGHPVERDGWALPMTADWCLFDAVQRFGAGEELPGQPFALLEGFSLYKEGARFEDGGVHDVTIQGETHRLRRITLIGHGVLPYEFWLDRYGRLILAVTHSRAYILQPDARERYENYAEERIARAKREIERQEQQTDKEK